MAEGDALSTHVFGVQLGGYLVESIQEISGMTVEEEVVEVRQVTAEGKQIIRKQPGARQAGEVTITRGLDKSSEFTTGSRRRSTTAPSTPRGRTSRSRSRTRPARPCGASS